MDNEIELLKIVNKKKTFVNSKGKEIPSYTYFVCFNGQMVPVKPLFNDGYIKLDCRAKVVVKD